MFNSRLVKDNHGYVLVDALAGVFLLALGLVLVYGFVESAFRQSDEGKDYLEAANLAQKLMNDLDARDWQDNLVSRRCIPDETVAGLSGKYHWEIYSRWESLPYLLRVEVEVGWQEESRDRAYRLESLYYVGQ